MTLNCLLVTGENARKSPTKCH